MKPKALRIAAVLAAAIVMSQARCAHGPGGGTPCRERCRYDYQFCNEESPAGSAHVTFPLAGGSGGGFTGDRCAEQFRKCTALCDAIEKSAK